MGTLRGGVKDPGNGLGLRLRSNVWSPALGSTV